MELRQIRTCGPGSTRPIRIWTRPDPSMARVFPTRLVGRLNSGWHCSLKLIIMMVGKLLVVVLTVVGPVAGFKKILYDLRLMTKMRFKHFWCFTLMFCVPNFCLVRTFVFGRRYLPRAYFPLLLILAAFVFHSTCPWQLHVFLKIGKS